jgi:DNA repair protein RecO (recombination protein O)
VLATTEAIILRSRKQGDTSKIVSLYTLDYGVVDVIAKGAREMKSKFGSALEPFSLSKVTFYKKEGRDLYLLSNAETTQALRSMQSDLDHIEAATKVVELLLRSQHHEESHPELFSLIKDTLIAMNDNKIGAAVWSILFAFYLQYILLSGFAIKLEADQPGTNYYFDIEQGEIFAAETSIAAHSEKFHKINPEVLASLKHLENGGVKNAGNLRLSESARRSIESLFRSYFNVHIEGMQQHKPKSGRVFTAMGR